MNTLSSTHYQHGAEKASFFSQNLSGTLISGVLSTKAFPLPTPSLIYGIDHHDNFIGR